MERKMENEFFVLIWTRKNCFKIFDYHQLYMINERSWKHVWNLWLAASHFVCIIVVVWNFESKLFSLTSKLIRFARNCFLVKSLSVRSEVFFDKRWTTLWRPFNDDGRTMEPNRRLITLRRSKFEVEAIYQFSQTINSVLSEFKKLDST